MTELVLVQQIPEKELPHGRFQKIGAAALTLTERPYSDEDYVLGSGWWEDNGRPHLPQESLSNLGLVIEQNGIPVAMGWIYLTNSSWAQLGPWVTDPKISRKVKTAALVRMMIVSEEIVRLRGYKMIQMITDQPTAVKLAQACGWTKMVPHEFLARLLTNVEDAIGQGGVI